MSKFLLFLFLFPIIDYAQAPSYPKNYFRNPLDIPILLAGNFGECRPNHFHSGIDIKTDGKENQPVYAAAEGYVSRIKMEPGGFGHGLYITHPNGFTTLYAHLNNFVPAIQNYVRAQQYEKQNWEVDLTFPPNKFPVKKGEQIAWSGNTGSSTAPHLHFEIRDNKTEHPLNPQLFGLPIVDHQPTSIMQMALYDLTNSVYQQTPRMVSLKKRENVYYFSDTLNAISALTGIAINADDYMDGSSNTLAFYTAELYAAGVLQTKIRLNDIGYDETRYLHAFADYKTKKSGGPWLQCLFRIPNNLLKKIYENSNAYNGAIALAQNEVKEIKIIITDDGGNQSIVKFWLRGSEKKITPCTKEWKAGTTINFENESVKYQLEPASIYDDICPTFQHLPATNAVSENIIINNKNIPVHKYFDLFIKPNRPIDFDKTNKIALIYFDGKEETGKAALPDKGWYKASVRNFGSYKLVNDITPPTIMPATPITGKLANNKIIFLADDALTSVKKFTGTIDGHWVLFEQHGKNWTYIFDSFCKPGTHELTVTATDENGNTNTKKYQFSR